MGSKAPRAGSRLAWLAERLQHTNAELVELAREAKLDLTYNRIKRARHVLKSKYGIAAKRQRMQRPTAAARRVAARPASQPDARQLKRSALRKLVFELGFDDACAIFEEFLAMHSRMGGNRA